MCVCVSELSTTLIRFGGPQTYPHFTTFVPFVHFVVEEESEAVKSDVINLAQLDGLVYKGVKSAYTGRFKTLLVVDPEEIALDHFLSDPHFTYVVLDGRKVNAIPYYTIPYHTIPYHTRPYCI